MASAELIVTHADTDELVRVMEATMREYDVDYIWLRSQIATPLGVVMTPAKFQAVARLLRRKSWSTASSSS